MIKNKILLAIKIASIGVVALLLLIPLGMVRGLLKDRIDHREEAMRAVGESWAGGQRITGPILAIPYQITSKASQWNAKKQIEVEQTLVHERYLVLTPDSLSVVSDLRAETRRKGIYGFPVYRNTTRLSGEFRLEGLKELSESPGFAWNGQPFLAIGVSDPRGIRAVPKGSAGNFLPGCPGKLLGSGIHARLPAVDVAQEGSPVAFDIELALQGMDSFHICPIGREVTINFKSNWPHPSFDGPFPVAESEVRNDGFSARWEVSHFATGIDTRFAQADQNTLKNLADKGVGIRLVDPVDVYQVTERAMKYGFLFVLLTFTAFFLFELLKRWRIHPVQYGLVGVALALFFLLLLSLAEHIAFGWAYLTATVICVGLLTYYVAAVLGTMARAVGFAGLLGVVYAALFTLLRLEDYALLAGSIFLFLVLAVVMVLTRRIDWHHIGGPDADGAAPAPLVHAPYEKPPESDK